MSSITSYSQQSFNTDFANTAIKVDDQLLQKVDDSLQAIGQGDKAADVKTRLANLAGNDGVISGKEVSDLFSITDHYDNDKCRTTFTIANTTNGQTTPTVSGAILQTLLDSRVKADVVGTSDLVAKYKGYSIDSCSISPEDKAQLQELGLSAEFLESCLDESGAIASNDGFSALFNELDKLDNFGEGVIATKLAAGIDSDLEDTKAGKALNILNKYASHTVLMDRSTFLSEHESGYFDLSKLSDGSLELLAKCGISSEVLNYYAKQNGNKIQGQTALNAIFSAMDAVDDFGDSSTIRLSEPLDIETSTPSDEQKTKAGLALTILNECYVSAQVYRSYHDLSRAAMEQEPAREPINLDVPCYAQPDATGCLRTCRKMLKAYSSALDTKVAQSGGAAHYMALAEDKNGAIKGSGENFQMGLNYIDFCLENNRPVIIGISDREADYNEGITDHFIIIVGRKVDEEGRTCYIYNDPATSGAQKTGPLYVDKESGMLFRPDFVRSNGGKSRQYQTAQLRPYTDAGFTFKDVTGQKATPAPANK